MDVSFDFVTTFLLHECSIKQARKIHFDIDLENTQVNKKLGDGKGLSQGIYTNKQWKKADSTRKSCLTFVQYF